MIYIILGIAAAGVLFFFFENEIKEKVKSKLSKPTTPKTKQPKEEKPDVFVDKRKAPDKSKLSFNEDERPVVLEKPKITSATGNAVDFEKADTSHFSEFDNDRANLKNPIFPESETENFASGPIRRNASTIIRDSDYRRAHPHIEEEYYSEGYDDIAGREKLLQDMGLDTNDECFADMFQDLPKIIKIMLIDNTIGKVIQ